MRLSFSKDGRKYTMVLLGIAIATVALFLKHASFPEWTYFVIPWGAFYLASNVGQKVAEMKSGTNSVTMHPEK